MKSMRAPSATIFFMTYFHRAGGAMAPSAPLNPLLCGSSDRIAGGGGGRRPRNMRSKRQLSVANFLPPANEVWGKVIFSQACVKNSVHGGGEGVPGPWGGVPAPGGCRVETPHRRLLLRAVRILLEYILV